MCKWELLAAVLVITNEYTLHCILCRSEHFQQTSTKVRILPSFRTHSLLLCIRNPFYRVIDFLKKKKKKIKIKKKQYTGG